MFERFPDEKTTPIACGLFLLRIPVHKRCLSEKQVMDKFICDACASATLKLVPSVNESQSSNVGPNVHAKVCSSGPGGAKAAAAKR